MMRLRLHFPTLAAGLLTCLCSLSVSPLLVAGEIAIPQPAENTNVTPATVTALDDALRQLKEQQASAFQAIELIRGHTENALQQNTAAVSNQLLQLTVAIADHSDRQLELVRAAEGRTLRVTLAILLIVLLAAGALLLFIVRTLRSLAHPPTRADVILDQAAGSAYTAALAEVEKRIAALEHKPSPPDARTREASSPAAASAAQRLKPTASVALALGAGEALVFLPREHSTSAGGRVVSALGRIGRMFKRS